ncbi:hypothetical protein SLEP1_g932 [Rubroshorea leprosula]|uniref:Uncharacterized protein n=1 Tax=Rubroshorea leprosula TaxID=152421 RepID=A0AAV5HHU3_9ROSI|nr:hypothetical protein SLEP1_g932 [Rubroshorea leprosula]
MASSFSSSNAGEFDMFRFLRAACDGNLPLFKTLVNELQKLGLKIEDVRDEIGLTALHLAAMKGRIEVCKYLVEEAKVGIDLKDLKYGNTPLHLAILKEQFPTVVYLLENGANPDSVAHRWQIKEGAEVYQTIDTGTLLLLSTSKEQKDFVKVLLDDKANPNVISYDLMTPLMVAVGVESIECVNILLEGGADPNLSGSKVLTPLALAACGENTEIINLLLKFGAKPDDTTRSGMTPVEIAASNAFHEVMLEYASMFAPMRQKRRGSGSYRSIICRRYQKGEAAFYTEDYFAAIKWYSEAAEADPRTEADMFSNRSLCWIRLNEGVLALKDAEVCIQKRPCWSEGYHRKGAALMLLKDFKEAVDAFSAGLMLKPGDEDLTNGLRELSNPYKIICNNPVNEVSYSLHALPRLALSYLNLSNGRSKQVNL